MDSDDYYPSMLLQAVYHEPVWNAVIILVVILLLLVLSGWLAAAERALFSLSADETNQVREEKSTSDKFIRQLSEDRKSVV